MDEIPSLVKHLSGDRHDFFEATHDRLENVIAIAQILSDACEGNPSHLPDAHVQRLAQLISEEAEIAQQLAKRMLEDPA